ncbi:hypothetical protein C8R43DRAFT_1120573 [Mycena crocata]|nr:hypothetical protein C8R43DRAFT_1120573 [Mycena crocata]
MDHWKSLPVPKPFVFGFALTPSQLRAVTCKFLPHLSKDEDDRFYHVELVQYFRKIRRAWTVLQTPSESGELRFLWVTDLIPIWNWDGRRPTPEMPSENIELVRSKFGLQDVETMCIIWPAGVTPPDWLVTQILKKGREKARREGLPT